MSDQLDQTEVQQTEQDIATQSAPQISEEKIQEIVKAAVTEAQAKQPKGESLNQEQIAALLEKQRVEIAKSIAGVKEDPDARNPIHEAFINNPAAFLDRFAEVVKKQIKDEQIAEVSKRTEWDKAYLKVLADRPDVTHSESAQKVFLNFYQETSEDKTEEERFKAALDAYDVFLEGQNAGDAKARVDRARGMSLNTSQNSGDIKPTRKSEAEILLEEQREQKERFLRSRGRL